MKYTPFFIKRRLIGKEQLRSGHFPVIVKMKPSWWRRSFIDEHNIAWLTPGDLEIYQKEHEERN